MDFSLLESIFGLPIYERKEETLEEYDKNVEETKKDSIFNTRLIFFLVIFAPITALLQENIFSLSPSKYFFNKVMIFLVGFGLFLINVIGQIIRCSMCKKDETYIKYAKEYMKAYLRIYRRYMYMFIIFTIIILLNN